MNQTERILSPSHTEEWRLSAWSVRMVLSTRTITILKKHGKKGISERGLFHNDKAEGRIIVYEAYFKQLLAHPKSLRDQLLLELPILQALRTGEIVTLHVGDFDFEHGDLYVLDSKKHQRSPIPLEPNVDRHSSEYFPDPERTGGVKKFLFHSYSFLHHQRRLLFTNGWMKEVC
jgi:integrase